MEVKAIPTTYAGINFRSRLEAKWAVMFDALGWQWEYEPFDLPGWIPDFVLRGKDGPVLVEVKPVLERPNTTLDKISRAAQDTDYLDLLILGAAPFVSDVEDFGGARLLGWLGTSEWGGDVHGYSWAGAPLAITQTLLSFDFFHPNCCFRYRLSGEYDGDHHIRLPTDQDLKMFKGYWAGATNRVQWKAATGRN